MDNHYNREMRIVRLCNIARKIGAQTNLEQTLWSEIRRMGVSDPTGRSYIKAVVARLSPSPAEERTSHQQ